MVCTANASYKNGPGNEVFVAKLNTTDTKQVVLHTLMQVKFLLCLLQYQSLVTCPSYSFLPFSAYFFVQLEYVQIILTITP